MGGAYVPTVFVGMYAPLATSTALESAGLPSALSNDLIERSKCVVRRLGVGKQFGHVRVKDNHDRALGKAVGVFPADATRKIVFRQDRVGSEPTMYFVHAHFEGGKSGAGLDPCAVQRPGPVMQSQEMDHVLAEAVDNTVAPDNDLSNVLNS